MYGQRDSAIFRLHPSELFCGTAHTTLRSPIVPVVALVGCVFSFWSIAVLSLLADGEREQLARPDEKPLVHLVVVLFF